MAKIFLSIPILDRPELKMLSSIYQAALCSQNHHVRMYFNENDSLISRVRNVHMSVFLQDFSEHDYFMSIDSDIEVMNAFPNNNVFDKLIECDKDFVGGLYALKNSNQVVCSSTLKKDYFPEFDSGVIPVRWLSSGCWCLKREAVERMVNAYPQLEYDGDDNMSNKKVSGLYMPYIHEHDVLLPNGSTKSFKKYMSEDWAFCQRWNDIGGEIFADTGIALNHIGKTQFKLWNLKIQKTMVPTPQPPVSGGSQPPPVGFDLK